MGRQEIAQPSPKCFTQGMCRTRPQSQRELTTQADIAHLVEAEIKSAIDFDRIGIILG